MEHVLKALPSLNKSQSLMDKFYEIVEVGSCFGEEYPEDAEGTQERIKAEFHLMLYGEEDLNKMRTSIFEEIIIMTKCCDDLTAYLNTYRNLAAAYLHCEDILMLEEAWQGARLWYDHYETCQECLGSSRHHISSRERTVNSLLGKDTFGNKDEDYDNGADRSRLNSD